MPNGVQFNGVWSKIIASLGVAGLLAALGAGIRLEVLAKDYEKHEEIPCHTAACEQMRVLRDSQIRQEAINKTVEKNTETLEAVDGKIDEVLRRLPTR